MSDGSNLQIICVDAVVAPMAWLLLHIPYILQQLADYLVDAVVAPMAWLLLHIPYILQQLADHLCRCRTGTNGVVH